MNPKRMQRVLITVLQVIMMCSITFLSGYLLMKYCAFGEREVSGEVQGPLSRSIRVRIMSNDFLADVHSELLLASQEKFTVVSQKRDGYELVEDGLDAGDRAPDGASELVKSALRQSSKWNRKTETELRITPEDLEESEVLMLEAPEAVPISVNSLERADGIPQYHGSLYVWREKDGLALLNMLPLEQYLYGVVSSEMPSNYPLEAQKAQAVCARTYAINCMRRAGEGELAEDLTDSVNYQVYNNYRMTDISKQAVDETSGEIMPLQDIQYYSTSCLSENRNDLDSDEAFEAFLAQKPEDGAEYGSRWLRWHLEFSEEELLGKMETYTSGKSAGGALSVSVGKRRGDGQVQTLCVTYAGTEFTVEGEYAIREFLGIPQADISLMDGSQVNGMRLLPSAFFCIGQMKDAQTGLPGFTIQGGGYGHGNGMSQCGAATMAEKGMDYKSIIGYYYSVTTDYL